MAWTQADVDALKAAIAAGKGARTITFGDQTINFHSIDDMLKLLSVMQADASQAAAEAAGISSRTRFAATSKGV
jgi:hypothetical protein